MSDGISSSERAANDERLEASTRFEANIDDHDCGLLIGWAWDRQHPDRALAVEVRDASGARVIGRADRLRQDLLRAGKGNGRHGFEIHLDLGALTSPVVLQLFEVGGAQPLLPTPYVFELDREIHVSLSGVEWGRLSGVVSTVPEALDHHADPTLESEGEAGRESEASLARDAVSRRLAASHAVLIDAAGQVHGRAGLERVGAGEWRFTFALPATLHDAGVHVLDVAIEGFPGAQARFIERLPVPAGAGEGRLEGAGVDSHVALRRYAALRRQLGQLTHRRQGAVKALTGLHRAHQVLANGWEGRRHFPTLTLSAERKPAFSVLLMASGNLPRLYHTLASLILTAGPTPFEVLLVDTRQRDAAHAFSVKTATPWLSDQIGGLCENLRVVAGIDPHATLGQRFAQAMQEASSERVVWLAPGFEVLEGALEALNAAFDGFDDVAVASASGLEPDGRLRHAGAMFERDGQLRHCGASQVPRLSAWRYVRRVEAALPGAVMFDRGAWNMLGGWAAIGDRIETLLADFCLRAAEQGWHCVHQPRAEVIALDAPIASEAHVDAERSRFLARWIETLRGRGRVGDEVAPAYRILMIDHEVPRPDQSAGAYAAWQEMRLLQANGCQVSFVADNLEHAGRYTQALQDAGVRCFHAPEARTVVEVLKRYGRTFDVIYVTRFNVAEKHLAAIREHSTARVAFNNADLHFLRELRLRLSARDPDLSFPLAIRERELAVMREADAVLCYSDAEQAVITSHNLRNDNLHRCPWVVEGSGHRNGWSARAGIAFLGGYRHRPNVETS